MCPICVRYFDSNTKEKMKTEKCWAQLKRGRNEKILLNLFFTIVNIM